MRSTGKWKRNRTHKNSLSFGVKTGTQAVFLHGASFPRHYHFFFLLDRKKKIRNPHRAGRGVFSALEEVTDREFCDIVKQNLSEKVKYKMISEKIFELILRNGVTQKEFSEETGISQSTISDWKRKGTNQIGRAHV